MKQKRILVPSEGPESWRRFLAEPEKHWKSGYSALSTAHSWETADGLPPEIKALFDGANDSALRDASLALAIPEYKVPLKGGSRPSQNDVCALVSCAGGLAVMMVEGKAREDFGAKVGDWKSKTSPAGAEARIADVSENLGIAGAIPDHVRYQLLHRAASAVIEARRFHAPYAVMLIQSFVDNDAENHYGDFGEFLGLFQATPVKHQLVELSRPFGRKLFAAWVQSEPS
jgi:hypothetical protein